MFILNTHIIYHATSSLIMHELWLIITHIFHYHKLGIVNKIWVEGGPTYFFASFEGEPAQFFARSVGGPPILSQENLKIECTINQISYNINRQIISSTLYFKTFSGPPIMFLVFHVLQSTSEGHLFFILSTLGSVHLKSVGGGGGRKMGGACKFRIGFRGAHVNSALDLGGVM